MFTIELKYIKNFSNYFEETSEKKAILYADFNVINYLYETGYKPTNPNIFFYPDSTAVFFILRIIYGLKHKKLVSTDMLDELLNTLIISKRKIFFFGNSDEVLNKMIEKLRSKYPLINICGYYNGYNYNENIISEINKSGAEILFVGLGAGRQEKWILDNFEKLNCRLIISCGGWFNHLAGVTKRAPLFLRKVHLEWLYKLIIEFPRVWKRYTIGITKYFYNILTKKITLVIK